MLIADASKELPDFKERKKIMDRAQQTLKNALMLLDRLDKLEECQIASHTRTRAQIGTRTF